MVRSELRLETVGRFAERRGHDTCVCDHEIERSASRDECVRAFAYARERCEIQAHDRKAAAAMRRGSAHAGRHGFRFIDISRRSDDPCAVRRERSCRLDAEAGGDARDQSALAA